MLLLCRVLLGTHKIFKWLLLPSDIEHISVVVLILAIQDSLALLIAD